MSRLGDMAGIIDSHTHLEGFHRKGVLEEVLGRAEAAGLERLVTIGTDVDDWDLYADLSDQYDQIEYTVGIHPCSVDEDWQSSFERIESYWGRENPPRALGETGLDRFHLPKDEVQAREIFERQIAAFDAQLALARRLGCPLVIHSRGAFSECVERVDAAGVDWSKVVFHCFSEGPGEMAQLKERGGWGSFTGVITFKNAESVREAAKYQGLDRLMIETDAPYLAPMPHRGKPNEPAYLAHTAAYCAELFGVSAETLAEKTTDCAKAFYGFG